MESRKEQIKNFKKLLTQILNDYQLDLISEEDILISDYTTKKLYKFDDLEELE